MTKAHNHLLVTKAFEMTISFKFISNSQTFQMTNTYKSTWKKIAQKDTAVSGNTHE